MDDVIIIGGGLAGVEAASVVARLGASVTLYEMKPHKFSAAHNLEGLGELVCSNSLKSLSLENGSGLLKEEMRLMGSLVVEAAEATRVPAGQALAVDRERFSAYMTERLVEAGVNIVRKEITELPKERPVIIATGPLTSDGFAAAIGKLLGVDGLFFYDAIAPVIFKDSIDFDIAFMGSRYGKGGADYINCPMNKEEYEAFVCALLGAEKTPIKGFEKIPYFEGCMPVEAMAERGPDTLAFGPLRPVGFTDPRTGTRPYALVQLRCENDEATIYNIVGFQTRLTRPEQKRVLSLIPGLKELRFARYGSIHRNSYINSPLLLSENLELKNASGVFMAGQITGVEGYCESAMMGIMAGVSAFKKAAGAEFVPPPPTTMTGALIRYITSEQSGSGKGGFQPMNSNFGIIEGGGGGKKRRAPVIERAQLEICSWRDKNLATL
jgi:methylenetetrahydrofolate--tRNA-(uracil-5-)-methyltransferase